MNIDSLKQVIQEFTRAAIKFHHRQDLVNLKDSLKVRKFNDQLMLLERAFLDYHTVPIHSERKHIILSKYEIINSSSSLNICYIITFLSIIKKTLAPHDGQEHNEGFPGIVDWITLLEGDTLDALEYKLFVEILKVHYKAVILTISNAIKIIDEVHIL